MESPDEISAAQARWVVLLRLHVAHPEPLIAADIVRGDPLPTLDGKTTMRYLDELLQRGDLESEWAENPTCSYPAGCVPQAVYRLTERAYGDLSALLAATTPNTPHTSPDSTSANPK